MSKLIYKTKSGIVILPQAVHQLLAHTRYFIYEIQRLLAEHRELQGSQTSPAAQDARSALVVAQQTEEGLKALQNELHRIYAWNFERLAEVFRQSRIYFEQRNILDVFTIKIVLKYLMDMLVEENPKFDREKFITYINKDTEEPTIKREVRRLSAPMEGGL
jgi:hypothetical protein